MTKMISFKEFLREIRWSQAIDRSNNPDREAVRKKYAQKVQLKRTWKKADRAAKKNLYNWDKEK